MPKFLDYEGLKYYNEKINIGIKYKIKYEDWTNKSPSPLHRYTIKSKDITDKYIEDIYMYDSSSNTYIKVICQIKKYLDGTVDIMSNIPFDGFVLIKNNN